MNISLTALSGILVLAAGCASQPTRSAGSEGSATFGKEMRAPEARDPLIHECRVPCSVTPGPGCC